MTALTAGLPVIIVALLLGIRSFYRPGVIEGAAWGGALVVVFFLAFGAPDFLGV